MKNSRSEKETQAEKYYATRYGGAKNNIIDENCNEIIPKLDSMTTISVETETGSKVPLYFFKNIDSTRYVELETTEKSLIGGINLILFAPNRIFCISNVNMQNITIFDEKGRFVNKIDNIGKGPDEYLNISQVAIDYRNSNIVLMDRNSNKLIRYDYDGEHIFTQQMFFYFSDIIFSKESDHIFYSSDIENNMHINPISSKRLICTKGKKELTYASINLPKEYIFAHYTVRNFSYSNDKILYFPNFSDTIYTVDSCHVIARYKLKHKGNSLKMEDCSLEYFKNFQYNFADDNIFYIKFPPLEVRNYIYLRFEQGGRNFYSLYNKDTRSSETGFIIASDNDVAPVYGYPMAVNDDWFVSIIDAESIVQASKNNVFNDQYLKRHADLKKIAQNITINDNPVVMFCKPKVAN